MTAQEVKFSNFYESTLNGILASGATAMTLTAAPTSEGTSAIAAPYYLVIDPDNASNREVVLVTGASGTTVSAMTRDVEGRHTTDPTHVDGTTVRMAVIKEMFEDLHDRVDALPTNTSADTLTNKTIDSDNNTITNIVNADIKAAAAIDATKIADGSVTSAEFQHISTLSSNAQTQIDSKLALAGGTMTGAINAGDQEISAAVLKDYAETDVALSSSSGVVSIDLANGNTGSLTLTENVTDIDFTNVPTNGVSSFTVKVTQHASSAKTVVINAVTVNGGSHVTAKTAGAGGYVMTTTTSAEDLLFFLFFDAGTPYLTATQGDELMSMLLMLKEGGSLGIDTIGNKPIDEDINITDVLKFILASGSADNITVANNSLSFTESDGSTDNISTMGGILSFTKYDGTVDNINLIN